MSELERLDHAGAQLDFYPDGPQWDGAATTALARFAFPSPAAGRAMLRYAIDKAAGKAVLAPMEGDTWHPYRTVVESDGSPPFLLEPQSGAHDRAALEAAGFAPVAHYVSSRVPLDRPQADPAPVDGIIVRAWDGKDAQPLLEKVFDMAGQSFADKQFYRPITRAAFLAMYLPLLPMLDPRLVFLARDGGQIAGFLLGYRDPADPSRAVLKTYAAQRRGVGHLLADAFHKAARALGCTHAVHALMHEDNVSRNRSAQHGAKVFRRYVLYGHRG